MKKKMYVAFLSIVVFIVLIFSATFAYFYADVRVGNEMKVVTKTPAMYSIVTDASGEINMYISEIDMLESNVKNEPVATDNVTLSLIVKSGSQNDVITCNYDIAFYWDSEKTYMEADKELAPGEYEYSLFGNEIEETDFSNFDWEYDEEKNKYKAIIISDQSMETNSTDGLRKSYEINSNFYNIDVPQDKVLNSIFKGHFEFENLDCTVNTLNS